MKHTKVYYGEYDTFSGGYEIKNLKTNEEIGIFTGSVGNFGTSTGAFQYCVTTNPFDELNLEVVDTP